MVCFFIVLISLLLYTHFFFPLAMAVATLFERKVTGDHEPSLAVLIPARNEAPCIAAKITNTLTAEYPKNKLHVIVASDGSTDGTDVEVGKFAQQGVEFTALAEGSGKATAINCMARMAEADVLVLTDADVLIEPTALHAIARRFADPSVGAVCARRINGENKSGALASAQQAHCLFESMIKRGEGSFGHVVSGDGALYAIRKDCFHDIPAGVPDDFVCMLRVLKAGLKVVYEVSAIAKERPSATEARQEFMRRRRTVARGVRGLWEERGILNPLRFPLSSFLLVSHKILRWMGGFIMAGLLLSNALLLEFPVFRWLFGLQIFAYLLAGLGCLMPHKGPGKLPALFRHFVLSHLGAAMGVVDFLLHRDWTTWQSQR
jgi:cellulose synthase/poly-beta-1,6-N-acetylglucosamine synthase-like glycosyltransferase